MTDAGSQKLKYIGFYDNESRTVRGVVPKETVIILYVNGEALVRLMCTPTRIEELALGFLFNEGLIERLDDVAEIGWCGDGHNPDIWLTRSIEIPDLRAITSGCSGGTTFEDLSDVEHVIESRLRIPAEQLTTLMEDLSDQAKLYRRAGGVHTAALASLEEEIVCMAEDVGRHNTLDKITGACLRKGQPTEDHILLTSGRISAEMVSKAAHMKVPIVVSRTSPTSLSIQLARNWGITLIGYTRRRSFRVYSAEERVVAKP